ncbi:spindle and kinetochore-associated protein 3 isoform X2 [Echinops telfairi]|uniref:Spindle and kinetochore-associated protein 3 isoform X2 n=1 Tax=Echinops telfairi TaxID=9371 RepID=A0AC55DE18_ECHTE|nr:spindle and kinetochore-associated protein 3 isoform X2 [Echinops telfairi]
MDPIRSFYGRLRSLAVTLDSEAARLQPALTGEESDFEDYAMKNLCDLQSEVKALKNDANHLLHKASLENKESTDFLKTAKVLMKRNSAEIMKIREFFQKYGYNPRTKENSAEEHETTNSKPDVTDGETLQKPDGKDLSIPSSSVSDKLPRSPQLSDFGLERYMIAHIPPPHPQEVNDQKEEPRVLTPPAKQSPAKILKTPRCALQMDDFECITPKLEHFGISEYTYLNEDYTLGLNIMESNKSFPMTGASEGAIGTEPIANDDFVVSPGPVSQQLGKPGAEYTLSPLAPTFCTPGLRIPPTINSADLEPSDEPLTKAKSSTSDLERTNFTSLILNSKESFENLADPSSPTISSYENLLRTPTPPEVTTIPVDILQILSKYNSNLATPVAVKTVPPRKVFLPTHDGQNVLDVCNKEN